MSLARKTTHGLFWASLTSLLIKIINFSTTVVLARLLEPEHFGLIAISLTFIGFFDIFKDMGVGTALIYKKDDIDKAANTAFFVFPSVAVVFYAVSYVIAPMVADFFNEPQVTSIIRVLSLAFIISSFWMLPNSLMDKNLEFKKKVLPLSLPRIGYGIAAIWLALKGFGVWSLVFGWLVLEMVSIFTLWHVITWRPSYKFDRITAFELISYGKQVVGASILVFLISIVDVALIGRILGATDLGYYSIALGIAGLLTTQVSTLMRNVMFPVYSTLQDDRDTLNKAFIRTIKYVSLISIPASFAIFMVSQDFVNVVYGPKWLPAVAALQVLCFYGLNRSLLGTIENLYLAAGKPEVRTKLNLIQLVLMATLMYPLTISYGIMGSAIAAMLPSFLVVFLTFREAGKIIGENFMNIARPLMPAFSGSVIMMLVIWAWQDISATSSPVLRLIVSAIIGSSVYVAFFWITRRELFYEIRELMMRK